MSHSELQIIEANSNKFKKKPEQVSLECHTDNKHYVAVHQTHFLFLFWSTGRWHFSASHTVKCGCVNETQPKQREWQVPVQGLVYTTSHVLNSVFISFLQAGCWHLGRHLGVKCWKWQSLYQPKFLNNCAAQSLPLSPPHQLSTIWTCLCE